MKHFACLGIACMALANSYAQKIAFTEYDLPNGLHVILHQDKTAPVVAVSVMYHVGSKDEDTARTGFAHFFEHLLFEGTDNIKRGEWDRLVTSRGGNSNANTTQDRTYYHVVYPSNQLEMGLWMESERMMHPVINEVGVETQNEVVKEEKRLRMDNQPYGALISNVFKGLFKTHPYRWPTIGSMEHLDAASLPEFQAFFKKYYLPNNAVLTIAGDIDTDKTKQLVKAYFGDIPAGPKPTRNVAKEQPITKTIIDTAYDANIQLPAVVVSYRTPGMATRDAKVLDMLGTLLSGGSSSRLTKKMMDVKQNALQVGAFPYSLEDYGMYILYAIPNNNASLADLQKDIDDEIKRVQTELIPEAEFQKLQAQIETRIVNNNTSMAEVANNLADAYMFTKSTNSINEELATYRSITREELRAAAQKYLQPNARQLLYYLPKSGEKTF
ncbi:M16 family metallopeptidase [Flavisolibacter tropicus]|uniref:Peptidase M16 n=1 Tax=Flavisolibacter tropicus TaxID=1492898 RepID=A0A172TVT9_9BACT|nr:pitrilysin family protein [Flavisolibacter tropicus]ANE51096.1 peptidase M16 [Flavisolibacter tropicus]